jgi:hypothetical protein
MRAPTIALAILLAVPSLACADDGGISFWLPGLFGSLAAVSGVPGWAFASHWATSFPRLR